MCDYHQDTKRRRLDPTRSGSIRSAWETDARVRIRRVERRLKSLIEATGGVGLSEATYGEAIDKDLIGSEERPWWRVHIVKAYRHGLERAAKEMGHDRPTLGKTHLNVIDMIVGRTEQELREIVKELSRQLHERVASKNTTRDMLAVVRDRVNVVGGTRTRLVVNVEVIATNAEAKLNYYKANGVKKVGVDAEGIIPQRVQDAIDARYSRRGPGGRFASREAILAEFATAGDDLVCPICAEMEGQIFDLDDAYGIIPVHPNCRCDWIMAPDNLEEPEE